MRLVGTLSVITDRKEVIKALVRRCTYLDADRLFHENAAFDWMLRQIGHEGVEIAVTNLGLGCDSNVRCRVHQVDHVELSTPEVSFHLHAHGNGWRMYLQDTESPELLRNYLESLVPICDGDFPVSVPTSNGRGAEQMGLHAALAHLERLAA